MAIFKIGNSYIKLNGNILSGNDAVLGFTVAGTEFPESRFQNSAFSNYKTGKISIESDTPNALTVNYGDGTVATHSFTLDSGIYKLYIAAANEPVRAGTRVDAHSYTDGNSENRIVSLKFQNEKGIKRLTSESILIREAFPVNIDKLTVLEKLHLISTVYLESFPTSIANSNVKDLKLFNLGPALGSVIPTELFAMPLEKFDVSGSVDLSDIYTSNFSQINKLKNTLTRLSIMACSIATLPTEIMELSKLTYLGLDSNSFTTLPDEVNSLTSLTELYMGGSYRTNTTLTGWGNFGNLTNLFRVAIINTPNINAAVPAWFGNLASLRSIITYGSFQTVERADAYVNSFYDITVATANITGTSSEPFRGLTVSYDNGSPANAKPSGIYQQPAGYEQGVSNGTPASPMEKIWVMVNQYGHSWTLPA
jgi:hypothetical protein